jgi:hypothetical protein
MRRLGVGLPLLLAASFALAEAGAAQVRVEPERFDFGRVRPNRTLQKEFILRNFGDRELVIESVSTTCGCTAALLGTKTVKPGGTSPLRVRLETRDYRGKVERRVLLRTNDPKTPLLEIPLTATVVALAATAGK